jgi:hypothetical protein
MTRKMNSLSLRDDCMDAGGSATQDAVAERARERELKLVALFLI